MNFQLPEHLKKYIVEQDYSKYTPLDQAVWRFCLRQLNYFLSRYGHSCYSEGLAKTGISVESIPKISEMSSCLEKFGWVALPVSGFIPPAAFMELQSLGVLPIACDMRTIDHLLYTPAPDIVHEAAGHAPIIVDKEYVDYLKKYSQIAKKSIISKEDIDLYEAIRDLSDTKENPDSSLEKIRNSEQNLSDTIKKSTHVSEASQLSRMNWWTAEYGLIGDIKNPKIFGAGLLSSIGESKWCLSDKVKKIPLTVDCILQSYDITEPQPQLFVTPDFKTLVKVLNEFSEMMAFKKGGPESLDKMIKAESVNTLELDSGIQISGILDSYKYKDSKIIFFKFKNETQISINDQQILGHGIDYHQHGYSSPLGFFKASSFNLNSQVSFLYDSGFEINGQLININNLSTGATIYSFKNATMTYDQQIYFQPEWGLLDIVTGHTAKSVYGGPADRNHFKIKDDFIATQVPKNNPTNEQLKIYQFYQNIRDLRSENSYDQEIITGLFNNYKLNAENEWLLFIELFELAQSKKFNTVADFIEKYLTQLSLKNLKIESVINDGIKLAYASH